MSFLAPWFLLGALAVAGPILFHLIRRSVRERIEFSSLLFLRPTPPRATRRNKLEHMLLLLLRCLALLLLVTAFARPLLPKDNILPAATSEIRQLLLLVDTSASMHRHGLWEQAGAVARKYLDGAAPDDQVALFTFDRQPRPLVGFAEWSSWSRNQRAALAEQRLAPMAPGWQGTRLGLALTTAAEQFPDTPGGAAPRIRREVVAITDLQEGSKLDGLQGHDWPSGVRVILEPVIAKGRANAGLEILDPVNGTASASVRVRITNDRESNREEFRLSWAAENGAGFIGKPREVYLPPGQTRTFAAPELPAGLSQAALRLTGDQEEFDNTAWFAVPELQRVVIGWFGAESAGDSAGLRYYLERALEPTSQREVKFVSITPPEQVSSALDEAAFAVIPTSLLSNEVAAVRDWLARGKTALLVLTDTSMGPTLAALAALPQAQLTEARGDYALLGSIDFTHPIFATFADPRFSDFARIHFWKHRRWEIPTGAAVQVLAQFDDGSPTLAQVAVGKGTLLVLAAGWNPLESQLAVSSKFVPLMQTMLEWSGAGSPGRSQYQTGDSIPSPFAPSTASAQASVQWRKPDGKVVTLGADAPFAETDMPGVYGATFGARQRRFAVNLPLEESRTAPLSQDELARLGVPLQAAPVHPAAAASAQLRRLQREELEDRQKLWRWTMAGVLVVTLLEIVYGGWLARRVQSVGGTS